MARIQGAYNLGKALVENVVKLDLEFSEKDTLLPNNISNYGLMRDAIIKAAFNSGFLDLGYVLRTVMPKPSDLDGISMKGMDNSDGQKDDSHAPHIIKS